MRKPEGRRQYAVGSLFFLLSAFWFLPTALADVICDHSGGTLKGLVVEEHRDRIVLSTEEGEKTVLRSEIEEVFYSEPERNYLYLGNQALEEGDLGVARGFFQKALQINPALSEAADALERTEDLEKKQEFLTEGLDLLNALKKQWGITLAPGKDLAAVQEVRSGSLAERAGLAAGDGLAAAWSSSLVFLPTGGVAKELIGPPGSKLKLTLQRLVKLSAAEAANLKLSIEHLGLTAVGTGDRIIAINGKSTRYMPLGDARRIIQEAKGGIELLIHRDVLVRRE